MSSEHLERSLSLRRAGYSCGQSVLIPYAAEFGLDEELASAMALPLAGGMAKGCLLYTSSLSVCAVFPKLILPLCGTALLRLRKRSGP